MRLAVFLWISYISLHQVSSDSDTVLDKLSADLVQITFKVDAAKTVANVSRFWTSTGFCGPDPHQDVCDWLLMPSMVQNIALIGAIPYAGILQVRVHWLLDTIKYSGMQGGIAVYNFTCLDTFINILWQNGLMPGFEIMGNPSNFYTDFENQTQILLWSDLVYQLAKRYVDQYGLSYVQKWNFESWNEPKLKSFDGLNITIKGFLNYYDATSYGLNRASPRLRLGGPGGACTSDYDLNSLCWALLDHAQNGINYFTGNKDVKLDFVSIHKKGKHPFNTDVIFDLELDFLSLLHKHMPILAHNVTIYNDEADPQVSWSVDRLWQAEVTYAAMVAKIIVEHQKSLTSGLFAGINYALLSNDNGFLSYQPFPFTQRTQLARFQVNETSSPYVVFIRKPVYAVMGLLGLLGEQQVSVTTSAGNASKLGYQTQFHAGNISLLATIHQPSWANSQDSWQMSIIIYNSVDTSQTISNETQVSLFLENLPEVSSSKLKFTVYYMDNERTNPYKQWNESGRPPTPDWKLFQRMRAHEEPLRVRGPELWSTTTGNLLFITLSLPSVAFIHLCGISNRGPDQVTNVVVYNVTFHQVQLIWSDSCVGTKCIKTYEVEFSPNGNETSFRRINELDTLFTSFFYATLSDISSESTRGSYRVRVVDYWNRTGEYSLIVQYPTYHKQNIY